MFDLSQIVDMAKGVHNSSEGLSLEIFVASFAIYKRVGKKVAAKFERLLQAMEVQSSKLGEHDLTLNNHEKRIGVLETDVGQLKNS